jgi:hypothetical protein
MIIPAQYTGDKSTSRHSIGMASATAATQAYVKAKDRLLSVNEWKEICGPHSAAFQLTDQQGTPVYSKAAVGYYMRIDLPAPKNKTGYDWVIIEAIEDKDSPTGNSNYIAMRVRPAASPTDNSAQTAHFYESTATSTFVVERVGTRITAAVLGRNEVPNVKHNSLIDKLRNLLITISTILGFQKPQWKSLVVGLLK